MAAVTGYSEYSEAENDAEGQDDNQGYFDNGVWRGADGEYYGYHEDYPGQAFVDTYMTEFDEDQNRLIEEFENEFGDEHGFEDGYEDEFDDEFDDEFEHEFDDEDEHEFDDEDEDEDEHEDENERTVIAAIVEDIINHALNL